jgi:hypothetical protein
MEMTDGPVIKALQGWHFGPKKGKAVPGHPDTLSFLFDLMLKEAFPG